jgi:hypothetical protein
MRHGWRERPPQQAEAHCSVHDSKHVKCMLCAGSLHCLQMHMHTAS